MRKQTLVCAGMALALGLTACSSDGGRTAPETEVDAASAFPLEETIELEFFAQGNANAIKPFGEMQVFKNLQEKTNMTIQWTTATGADFTEKKNLIFASGELPDAFYGTGVLTNNEVVQYGGQGLIIPLEDLIAEYAPTLHAFLEERPDIKALITAPNGHIYSLPHVNEFDPAAEASAAMFVNQEWLDQVGLDVPQTTDELLEVLRAFKGKDLNGNGQADEIPMSFRTRDTIRGVEALTGAFGKLLNGANRFHVEDKTVYFTPMEPEYKAYVSYLHQLYSEGLIDPEVFSQEGQVYDAKIRAELPTVGVLFGWSRSVLWGQERENWTYVPISALKGPDGDQLWPRQPGGTTVGSFAIANSNPYPELTMRWIDHVYEERTSVEHAFGPFGSHLYEADNGKIGLHWPPEGTAEGAFRVQETPGPGAVYIIGDLIQRRPSQQEKRELVEMYAPYTPEEVYPRLMMDEENVNRLAVLEPELFQENGYIDSQFTQWVLRGNIDAEWDAYVAQLKRMNIEEIVEIYQSNYDRFLASQEQ
ncbi:extracellular solute-binding protein [Paenibacillus sp. 598K]|uniref:extracellular solute-binding protein n=1 Tax=Paenibacillus sp. 598K TaxID=1117987 RepID=UPI0016249C21|nr:extracellular solute-binding protein [Paenibacillus sp. 598K]